MPPVITAGQMFMSSTIPPFLMYLIELQWPSSNQQASHSFKFAVGFTCILTLNNFAKITIGRQRPHFLAANNIGFDPNDFANYVNPGQSIEKYSNESFFSGHAMLGLYNATYVLLYIQDKVVHRHLYAHCIQFLILLIGIYPGLTQISNYKHHWSDVAAGYLIGLIGAYAAFNFVC